MRHRLDHSRYLGALLVTLALLLALPGSSSADGVKSLYVNADLNAYSPIQAYAIQPAPTYLTYQAVSNTTGYGGAGLAIDTDSATLFVTFEGSGSLKIVDAATLYVPPTGVPAPGASNLAGIVVDQELQKLYTVDRGTAKLFQYSWDATAKTLSLDGQYTLPGIYAPGSHGAGAHGIALDETGDLLYVADVSDDVKVFNTSDWSSAATVHVTAQKPMGVALDEVENFLYSGNAYPGYGCNGLLVKTDLNTTPPTETSINVRGITGVSTDCVVGLAVDLHTGLVYITTGNQASGGSDRIMVFDSNLNHLYSTGDIGNPTGIVVPGQAISYNPLNLSKDDGLAEDACLYAGDRITYQLCYDNTANDYDVYGVSLEDTLPPEVDFWDATGGGTYDSLNHMVTWNLGDLEAGASQQCLQLQVDIEDSTAAETELTNNATIDSDDTGPAYASEVTEVCPNQPPAVIPDLGTVTVDESQTANNAGTVSDPDGDPVGLSASIGTVVNNNDGTWSWSFPTQDGPTQSQTVTITGDDGNGGVTQVDFSLIVNNVPPSVVSVSVPSDPVDINDQPVPVSAGFTDPAGAYDQPYSCEVDYGDGSGWQVGSISATTCIGPGHTYAEAGVYQVLVTVTDKDGGSGAGMATGLIVIYDPSAGFVTGGGWIDSPVDAYYPSLPFFDGSFYELVESPGIIWDLAQLAASGASTVSCASPHLVTITSEQEQEALIEFFDGALQGKWYGGWQEPLVTIPDQGWHWVTEEPWEYTNWAPGEPNDASGPGSEPHLLGWAGGWAWNDEGNLDNVTGYVIEYDDCLTGKATFGFVSKYKKGTTVPTGNTEFQFHAVGLNFHSDSYEWLVVTGGNYARFKGVGTINGEGEYKFMLWAGDGEPDTFRIKIWTEDEENGVETVVYDNGFDQQIGGGSIVVHAKNK